MFELIVNHACMKPFEHPYKTQIPEECRKRRPNKSPVAIKPLLITVGELSG